ncbi:4'-phosphopantetheinyl transferase superfamily protein [bacterium]|nr:4'-phosphopantetheinyl transferase superfamily protein [bacterium]
MIGIDLFEIKRKIIFCNKNIIKRFFFDEEINQSKIEKDSTLYYAKLFSVKEAVYKLLHNLYPTLYFNKFSIKVAYANYVFKVEYVLQNNKEINNVIKTIDFKKIFISDADEKDYLITIAMLSN